MPQKTEERKGALRGREEEKEKKEREKKLREEEGKNVGEERRRRKHEKKEEERLLDWPQLALASCNTCASVMNVSTHLTNFLSFSHRNGKKRRKRKKF